MSGRRHGVTLALALAGAAGFCILPAAAYADREGDRHEEHRGGHHESARHGHRYRVYAPPTVYYPQARSPGIRLVVPIEIH